MVHIHHVVCCAVDDEQRPGWNSTDPVRRFHGPETVFPILNRGREICIFNNSHIPGMDQKIFQAFLREQILELSGRSAGNQACDLLSLGSDAYRNSRSAAETHQEDSFWVYLGAEGKIIQTPLQVPGPTKDVEIPLTLAGSAKIEDQNEEPCLGEMLGEKWIPPIVRPLGLSGNPMADDQRWVALGSICRRIDFPLDLQSIACPENFFHSHEQSSWLLGLLETQILKIEI